MNLCADESVDWYIVIKLRESGYEIPYMAKMEPGIIRWHLLDRANQTNAGLLTEDKDFGELVYRQKLIHEGVILMRLSGISSQKKADLVLNVINEHGTELKKVFCVISPALSGSGNNRLPTHRHRRGGSDLYAGVYAEGLIR